MDYNSSAFTLNKDFSLHKTDFDVFLETIENYISDKNFVINESYLNNSQYAPMLEAAVDLKKIEEDSDKIKNNDDKDGKEKIRFFTKVLNDIKRFIKWWNSQNPEDKCSSLRLVIKILLKIAINLTITYFTGTYIYNPLAKTLNIELSKITRLIIKTVVSAFVFMLNNFLENIISDKILLPVNAINNAEISTTECITKLKYARMKLQDNYSDCSGTMTTGEKAKLLLMITDYGNAINSLERNLEYLNKKKAKEEKKNAGN